MPELPEVSTTVAGINGRVRGKKIIEVWTDYFSPHYQNKQEIKNPRYFSLFKKAVEGGVILGARRRGKYILIDLSNGVTVLIHMKMTGHLLHGRYVKRKKEGEEKWIAQGKGALQDSFNQFIHLVFTFADTTHLALSDVRRFARISFFKTEEEKNIKDLSLLGLEPLERKFSYDTFKRSVQNKKGAVKKILMDQRVIVGIGNIYSDEILWRSDIHPLSKVEQLTEIGLKKIFRTLKSVLRKGIDFGGDSTSDYRNIDGERGRFHETHRAYQNTGKRCQKRGCRGVIQRIQVGGRSAHFCPIHQDILQ